MTVIPATGGNGSRLLVAVATLVGWTCVTLFGAKFFFPSDTNLEDLVTHGISWQILSAGALLIAVIFWKGWRDLGFRRPAPKTLRLLWFPALLIVLIMAVASLAGLPSTSVMALVLLNSLLVGFSEETMFRGILFRGLRQYTSIWPAVLLTTVAFGMVHVLNGVVTGDYSATIMQSILAASTGLLLMALFLRTGSLWIAIIFHGLWDAAAFIMVLSSKNFAETQGVNSAEVASNQGGIITTMLPFLMVLPGVLYALWLLRHIHKTPPPSELSEGQSIKLST